MAEVEADGTRRGAAPPLARVEDLLGADRRLRERPVHQRPALGAVMEPPHEQGPVDVVEDRHRLDRVGSGAPGGVDAALPGEPLRDRYLVAQVSARVEGGHERRRSFDHRSAGIRPLGWADRVHQAQGKVLVLERVRELVGQHQLQLPAGLDRALDEDDPLVTVVVGAPRFAPRAPAPWRRRPPPRVGLPPVSGSRCGPARAGGCARAAAAAC